MHMQLHCKYGPVSLVRDVMLRAFVVMLHRFVSIYLFSIYLNSFVINVLFSQELIDIRIQFGMLGLIRIISN